MHTRPVLSRFVALTAILLGVLSVSGCGQINSAISKGLASLSPTPTPEPTQTLNEEPEYSGFWAPEGFTEWSSDIAYRIVTEDYTADCTDCVYWYVEVISSTPCSNGIYAELNILDGSTVIDWTNDTIPYLGTDQTGLLEFIRYPYQETTGQITTLDCNY